MKTALAMLLAAASFSQVALANDPAIPAQSRDRFLNGVNDFAGGKLIPGASQDPPPLSTGGTGIPQGAVNSPGNSGSSWRNGPGGSSGSIVRNAVVPAPLPGPQIPRSTVTVPKITPEQRPSPWATR